MVPVPWLECSTILSALVSTHLTFYRGVIDANLCEFVLAMPDEGNWSSAQEEVTVTLVTLDATPKVRKQDNDKHPEMFEICQVGVRSWRGKIATRQPPMLLDKK